MKCLRAYRDAPNAISADGQTVEQRIRGLLEGFIGECLSHDPSKRVSGWWSDGVIHLRMEQESDTQFEMLGVTWIGCEGTAPFEIDVVMDPTIDEYFAKCIFRLGMLDRRRCPTLCDSRYGPMQVLNMRPRNNGDWAIAVELTPSDEARN